MKYALNSCHYCLCEVCTRFGCPKLNRRYRLDFCASMLYRDRCPVVKCDYFVHKEKHKAYRVIRKHRKRDALLEKLERLEKSMDELAKKL